MSANGSPGAIMVVDDNEPSRDALSRRLERRGHRTVLAGADDFDTKPVRFRQLLGRIDALLKKAVAVR